MPRKKCMEKEREREKGGTNRVRVIMIDAICSLFPGPIQGAHFVQASFEKERSRIKRCKRLSGQYLTQNHGKQPHSSQFQQLVPSILMQSIHWTSVLPIYCMHADAGTARNINIK
jgi:hypothetical protein